MKGFLSYIQGESILHKLNPISKIYCAFMICASCFVCSNQFLLIALIALSVVLGFVAGIQVGKRVLSLLKGLVKISVFLFILQLLFIRSGNVVLGFSSYLYITDNALDNATRLVLRLIGASLPLAFMMSITVPTDLANALVEKLHLPYKYAFTFVSVVRFIPLFGTEMSNIIEAQTARGMELDTKNIFKKIKLIVPLCMPLLFSSVRKTELSSVAANLRGFQFRSAKCFTKTYPFKVADVISFILCTALLVVFCL